MQTNMLRLLRSRVGAIAPISATTTSFFHPYLWTKINRFSLPSSFSIFHHNMSTLSYPNQYIRLADLRLANWSNSEQIALYFSTRTPSQIVQDLCSENLKRPFDEGQLERLGHACNQAENPQIICKLLKYLPHEPLIKSYFSLSLTPKSAKTSMKSFYEYFVQHSNTYNIHPATASIFQTSIRNYISLDSSEKVAESMEQLL
eukprot:Sdes_comp10844_c1_seq1m2500